MVTCWLGANLGVIFPQSSASEARKEPRVGVRIPTLGSGDHMHCWQLRSRERQGGFTILELLIIVLILAVLAAVIIPNVSSFWTSGDLAAANKELAAVRTAADAYRSNQPDPDNGWPSNTNLPAFRQYYTRELRAIYYFDTDGSVIGKGLIERADTSLVVNPWPGTIHFSREAQRWEQTRR